MNKLKTITLASVLTLLGGTVAYANCMPSEDYAERWRNQFQEEVSAQYLSENFILEIYLNEETGAWTVATNDGSTTCSRAAGVGYLIGDDVEKTPEGDPT